MKLSKLITVSAFGSILFLSCGAPSEKAEQTTISGNAAVQVETNNDATIQAIMDAQSESWNQGDIEGFMDGYWKNERLTFIGSNGLRYGWDNTLEGYKKGYPDRTAMGELKFNYIEMKALGEIHYYTLGMWQLNREADTLSGYFTLLWEKKEEGWCIIADHSS